MSAFSVNTNAGAFIALQNLSSTGRGLQTVQNRISTGLQIASTKDDSAGFAIAQNLRGDVAAFSTVKSSLDRGKGVVDTAIAATESISDLLTKARTTALSATEPGLDQASIDAKAADFNALRDQIVDIVNNAVFSGTNIVKNGEQDLNVLFSGNDGDGTTAGFQADVFTLANQDLSLGTGTTAGAVIELGDASTFTDSASAATAVENVDNSITNLQTVLSNLGSAARQIDAQKTFVSKLSDVVETGIGSIVDADLAKESANLQALQTKQQLGLQALSIANQAPQSVLSLFR